MTTIQSIKVLTLAGILALGASIVQGAIGEGDTTVVPITPTTVPCNLSFAPTSAVLNWALAKTSGCPPINEGTDTQGMLGALGARALVVGGNTVSVFTGTAVGVHKLASTSEDPAEESAFIPKAHAQTSVLITPGYALDVGGKINLTEFKNGTTPLERVLCADYQGYVVSC